ncbi:hypothetical protein PF006_g27436 [Phytophthora fragariae]|uniref:Integrase catalytic domain-containing protein n=1 Tax=Phytophthora fragariae TaxID=53985 RepID=A0A6A3QN78_9STRA|nr:hypothetical protein PF006_g27436 [Phytophthora fragariae]
MLCANGGTVSINQVGSVELRIVNEVTGRQETRILSDVYYVPDAPTNLLSQDYMQTELNYFVKMSADQSVCFLTKKGTRLKLVKVNRLYRIWSVRDQVREQAVVYSAIVTPKKSVPLAVWHKRFAHARATTIVDMGKQKVVRGLQISTSGAEAAPTCLPCMHGKKVRMTYPERRQHAQRPLQHLQVDVCSVNEPRLDGCTSFLLVIDEFSRYKWLFLLRQKSEAKNHIAALVNRLHVKYRERNWRVEEIHSDQGGEFDNNDILDFCAEEGIELTTTNAYPPPKRTVSSSAPMGSCYPRSEHSST